MRVYQIPPRTPKSGSNRAYHVPCKSQNERGGLFLHAGERIDLDGGLGDHHPALVPFGYGHQDRRPCTGHDAYGTSLSLALPSTLAPIRCVLTGVDLVPRGFGLPISGRPPLDGYVVPIAQDPGVTAHAPMGRVTLR